jgi:hypothetical protein
MTTTINGRTPEEIKRSLKCRAMWGTPDCKMKCDECGTYVPGLNGSIMAAAAIALIQQLERERDAAVEAVGKLADNCDRSIACEYCEFRDYQCITCEFKWCGVQEVE